MKFKKEEETPVPTPTLDESLADISEALDPIRAAAVGYRAKLEADGYSPTMAEQMSAQLHALLMAKAFGFAPGVGS